jgi:hypothetical protein
MASSAHLHRFRCLSIDASNIDASNMLEASRAQFGGIQCMLRCALDFGGIIQYCLRTPDG